LAECVQRAEGGKLSFGDAFAQLDKASFPIIALILCLPYIQPISLGPLATVSGLVLAALGWQMAKGHNSPVIPAKLARIALSAKVWSQLYKINSWIFARSRKVLKPRLTTWVSEEQGEKIVGALICVGGLLIAVPFVGVPLNNTFPALMVVAACFAKLEEDGAMVLVSLLFFVVTLLYFVLVIYAALFLGSQVWDVIGPYVS
jgi:hypothetical protein